MQDLKTNKQLGFAHLGLIIVIILVLGAGGAGFMVFRNQQNKELARQGELITESEKNAEELKKKADELKAQAEAEKLQAESEKLETIETKPEVEVETEAEDKTTTEETKPESTKPSLTKVAINSISAVVGDSTVVFTAQLPGTYQGTCSVYVKRYDAVELKWKEVLWKDQSFASGTTCSVEVDKTKLTPGTEFKYYMYFMNSENTVKGTSSSQTLNI